MRFQNLMLRACAAVAITASTNAVASGAPAVAVAGPVTAIKAGRLVDVAAGRVRNDQVVLGVNSRLDVVANKSPTGAGCHCTSVRVSQGHLAGWGVL